MRILILNWRDIKNPSSGGAEILTHEIARRWIKQGHSITYFSSEFPNCSSEESIDGINIVRRGHPDMRYLFGSVHFQAFLYYKKHFQGSFDVVIDEIHGLPFFTPLFVREKKVALICEVADQLWKKMYGPFFGTIGRIMELIYLRLIYRNTLYLTISQASKEDLIKNGVKAKMITVLPMGITIPDRVKRFPKENFPSLLYVGRLSKSKGIEDAIIAFKYVFDRIKNLKFFIVGRGDRNYTLFLQNKVKSLNLAKNILFLGFVSEQNKFELMSKCHILIVPSLKEGFGLTVPEAGSVGTPSIVYNTSGLSEVVKDKKSGIMCKENNPHELAQNIEALLNNKKLYDKLSKGAYEESKKYSWDSTASFALKILQ